MSEESIPLETTAESAEPQTAEVEAAPSGSGGKSDFDTFFENNSDKVRKALAALMSGNDAPMGASETKNESENQSETDAPGDTPGEWQRKENELTAKEKELAEMEQRLNHQKLLYDTVKLLEVSDMPTSVAKFVVGTDMAETKLNIEAFSKEFRNAVQNGINDRLRGKPPGSGHTVSTDTNEVAREDIRNMMSGRK